MSYIGISPFLPSNGGTGVNNGSSTITIGGSLTFSGAYTFTGTLSNTTSVTFPTSGTLVNTSVATLSSLTSIGTIGTGTWQGTVIGATYGGTGVNNGSSTITLGGSMTMSGAYTFTGTLTGATSVTFPTSGTLATTAGTVTNATNVGITNTGTNATFYPTFISSDIVSYSGLDVSSSITFNPYSGLLTISTLDTGYINASSLTASQAVVTDSSKNFVSLAYTTANTASTIVSRDSSGNFSAGQITATTFVNTAGIVRNVSVITGSGAVTVTNANDIVIINKGTPAATVVNLPAPGTLAGQQYTIVDGSGTAQTYNLTLTPASGDINGASTFVMKSNYQTVTLIDNGTQYNII